MAAPHGQPPPPQQLPPPPSGIASSLPLVVAGAGLLGYLLGLLDTAAGALLVQPPGFALVAAAALAGLRMVLKRSANPYTLHASAVLAVCAALGLLAAVVRGQSSALLIIVLLLALVQAGAGVGAVLMDGGLLSSGPASGPQPAPFPPQGRPGPQGPGESVWNRQAPQQGGWRPDQMGGQPQPAQQPNRPPSGGFAPGQPQQQPQQQAPQQQAQRQPQQAPQQPQQQQAPQQQQGQNQSAGPKGTQQMKWPPE